MAYDYADKYLWDIPCTWNIGTEPMPLRPRIRDMPRPGRVDFDKLIDSEYGERMVGNFKQYILHEDEMDPQMLAYYESIGLKKELHEAGDLYTKWSLYVPVSSLQVENRNRSYPLLFVNHGACMPIHWEEHSGFLPIAAREQMFVIAAQNHNEPNLMRIFAEVRKNHNIDASRIYCTGYSQGGFQTNVVSARHPELFAAVAPCGIALFAPESIISAAELKNMRRCELPVIEVAGQEESLELFPVNLDNVSDDIMGPDRHSNSSGEDPTLGMLLDPKANAIPKRATGKIALLQRRLKSARCRERSYEECLTSAGSTDEVVRSHGFAADETRIFTLAGVRHFESTFINDEGKKLLKIVTVEGQPHWPQATMAEIVWDFMRHFRRDPDSKRLIIDG